MAYAMIDMIARAQRMLGHAVLFPFGLDRNGINIERTVEKKTGKALHRWDREAFIQECRKEIEAIGNGLLELAVRVGMSADFDHTYYTDSDEYRAFSQAIFLELWPKGLFYRGERPTFWCPVCETPLAEADIDYEERPSNLVWMKFPLTSKGEVQVEPIQHQTPICSRTLNPIEFLSSDAWYLKQLEFRDDLRRLAQEMEFRPTRHRQLVLDWIDSLTIDWPISRLRYYHTEIPLWYCKKCGETLAPPPGKYYRPWKDPAPFAKCPKCSSKEFVG